MHTFARFLAIAVLALVANAAYATVTSSVSGTTLTATSNAADAIVITCVGGNVQVNNANPGTGVALCAPITQVTVTGGPGANDLSVTGVNVGVFPSVTGVTLSGGGGDDTLRGSAFADILLGDADNDTIDGNQGADTALMGAGNDVFNWDPGDSNDVVEGQSGTDTLRFNGANVAEIINVSANGGRMLFTRDIANIVMDCDDVEQVEFNALGGADRLFVNPLQGTDVTQVTWNLAAAGGVGDGAADTVTFNGGAGADTFLASGNATQVFASDGATTVVVLVAGAEAANDQFVIAGQGGDDLLRANVSAAGLVPLRLDGGAAGIDTAEVVGTVAGDTINVLPNGTDVVVESSATVLFTAVGNEIVLLNTLGGNDIIAAVNGLSTLTALSIDAGSGNDTIGGGDGADLIIAGDGDDLVDGNRRNDTALMGADNDTFNWDPGDGSDAVEGQGGSDILRFNGSAVGENIQLSPNGGRVILFRDVASVTMDCNDTERVEVNFVGGIDTFTINDLAGTDVTQVAANLASSTGGGDAAADTVIVNGSAGADTMSVTALGALVVVTRPGTTTTIAAAEPANDQVVAAGLGGDDTLSASSAAGTLARIVLDGGANADTAQIDGENAAETFVIAPFGAGARITRTIPTAATIDANNDERLRLAANDGIDAVSTQLLPTLLQFLDGGAPSPFTNGDTLAVTNFGGDPAVSPVVQAGFAPVFHSNFEFGRQDGFLTGPQVVPATPSTAFGTGLVTLNAAGNAVTVTLAYSGLSSSNTLVHLHAPGARGANGPVLFNLQASGSTAGSFTTGPLAVSAAEAATLPTGQWYFDVHSVNFPNGEIRGQLDSVQFRDGFE